MHNCKTCRHAGILFEKEREEKHTTTTKPSGFVHCYGPR